jgi:hypothetical protein
VRLTDYNIADLRELARCRLPKGLFEYIDRALALIGCTGVAALSPEYLA